MLNKVMLIGRLGRDPELRYTQNGSPVTTLNIATDEAYTDKDGNRVERTEWHRVVVFQRQAENCATYLSKGSLAYVEGSLQTRKWQDQQGQDRYTTEIKAQRVQFLDRKGDNRAPAPDEYDYGQPQGQRPNQNYNPNYSQRNRPQGEENWNQPRNQNGQPARSARPAPPDDNLGQTFPSEGAEQDGVPF